MANYSDAQIIQMLRSGRQDEKEKAFRYLYQHYGKIEALVLKNSGKEEDVRTVFHDGLLALFKNAVKKDFTLTAALSTYLYSICRNKWLMVLRKRRNDRSIQLDDEHDFIDIADNSVKKMMDREKSRLLKKLIGQLGATCEQVLLLFYFEEKNMKEIAQLAGLSNDQSTKSQKHKCLKKLITQVKGNEQLMKILM